MRVRTRESSPFVPVRFYVGDNTVLLDRGLFKLLPLQVPRGIRVKLAKSLSFHHCYKGKNDFEDCEVLFRIRFEKVWKYKSSSVISPKVSTFDDIPVLRVNIHIHFFFSVCRSLSVQVSLFQYLDLLSN